MRVFVPCRLPLGPILILRIPGWLLFRSLANAYLLAPFADRSASYPRLTFSATSSFATSFSLAIYCHFCDPHRHHSLLQYSLLSFLARAAIFLSGRFFLKSGEKWHLLVRLFDSASSARLQTPPPLPSGTNPAGCPAGLLDSCSFWDGTPCISRLVF